MIEGENEMPDKYRSSHLLHELYMLYHRLFAIDLRKRMSLYHRHTGSNEAPDISTSLTQNLDKLAPAGKPRTVDTASTTSARSSKRTENTKPSGKPRRGISRIVNTFTRPKKIFTRMKTSDPYMGEKLKESTWSHIHAAQLQARQGNTDIAKLHAGIANDALKEAAHYMSEDDYKVLCDEVTMVINKLEGR